MGPVAVVQAAPHCPLRLLLVILDTFICEFRNRDGYRQSLQTFHAERAQAELGDGPLASQDDGRGVAEIGSSPRPLGRLYESQCATSVTIKSAMSPAAVRAHVVIICRLATQHFVSAYQLGTKRRVIRLRAAVMTVQAILSQAHFLWR